MSAAVQVCECWARDGLQSWPDVISLEHKLAILDGVVRSGVRELDATSLVPAKYAPQFADADELLERVSAANVLVRVLTPNLRGVERAIEINERHPGAIDAVGFPISASEKHNLANVRRTHEDHLTEISAMIDAAHDAGLSTIAAVATAFGCPIVGAVDEEIVFAIADHLVDRGVDRIMLSDTTGLADPVRVRTYTERALRDYPDVGLIAHFHDTRGTGLANTFAAVQAGIRCVDSSLGGIGGEPPTVEQNHAGESGNIATEDLVVLLERSGFDTGVDVEALVEVGRRSEHVLGRAGRSQVLRTGAGLEARAMPEADRFERGTA